MEIKDVKDMFKITDCRKSQAKSVNAWNWTFQSLLSEKVQAKVATYGLTPSDKNEEDAWKELEKAVCVFVK